MFEGRVRVSELKQIRAEIREGNEDLCWSTFFIALTHMLRNFHSLPSPSVLSDLIGHKLARLSFFGSVRIKRLRVCEGEKKLFKKRKLSDMKKLRL
jgi:hypothetical protein